MMFQMWLYHQEIIAREESDEGGSALLLGFGFFVFEFLVEPIGTLS